MIRRDIGSWLLTCSVVVASGSVKAQEADAPICGTTGISSCSLPVDGDWYELQRADNGTTLCEGIGTVCEIENYPVRLINHSVPNNDPSHRQELGTPNPDFGLEPLEPVELVGDAAIFTRVSERCRIPQEELLEGRVHSCTATCDGELIGLLSCAVDHEFLTATAPSRSPDAVPTNEPSRENRFHPIASFRASANSLVCTTEINRDYGFGGISIFDIVVDVTCR